MVFTIRILYLMMPDVYSMRCGFWKFVRIAKCIDLFISDKKIEKIYQKLEHQYDFESSEYTMSIVNYGKSTNCVKKEVLMETMECTFEDLKCAIPKDYDTYLTQIYGDYMTPVKY